MKTLQNNFTTPEQSKRLLELGVPADSADMLWDGCIDANEGWVFEDFPTYSDKPFSYYQLLYRQEDVVHILPCWSVGRLIEIEMVCDITEHATASGRALSVDCYGIIPNFNLIDWCVNEIVGRAKEGRYDFSKLEE